MRVAPPTNRPISGRRENLRIPARLLGGSLNRDFGISSGIHEGGLLDSSGAFFDGSIARFVEVFRRKRGREIGRLRRPAGKWAASGSRPDNKSPDFAPTRKSAISGGAVREIRKSGFRDLVRNSWGGGLLDSGGAFSDVSVACFTGVSGENGARKSTACADRRGPAFESRPAHKSPDFGKTRKSAISGDVVEGIRKSGFRDLGRTSYWGSIELRRLVF